MTDPTEVQRWEFAEKLDKIPTACWSTLADWAFTGLEEVMDDDGELIHAVVPDVTGGVWCAMGPELSRVGSCYCGKFRAGLELPCGATEEP